MKPFDLQKAKAGAPLVTRDGREVIAFAHFERVEGELRCVFSVKGENTIMTCSETGMFYGSGRAESIDDIFMAPQTRTVYVNLYDKISTSSPVGHTVVHHSTAEQARSWAGMDALAIAVPVEIEV